LNFEATRDALYLVQDERRRQCNLKATGKFVYGPEDAELSDAELLTALAEEVGEASHEINETIGHPERLTYQQRIRLRDELVQVAAVAVGRVELLTRQIEKAVDDILAEDDATGQGCEYYPEHLDFFAVGPCGAD